MGYRRNINSTFYKNLISVYCGWSYWRRITKKYHMKDDTAVIFMPSHINEHNLYGLLYLNDYLIKNNFSSAHIFTYDNTIEIVANMFSDKIAGIHIINEKIINNVVKYYSVVYPDPRLTILSLEQPDERKKSLKLLNINNTSVEEIIAIGIYKIFPFVKKNIPEISGLSREVEQFLYCNK